MPLTPHDLEAIVIQANTALNAIQAEYGRENSPAARIRFPRGFIRTATLLRATLPNIGTEVQRRNVCYSLMQLDVLRWIVVRTDLAGAALSMTVKQGIIILGGICEWMTKEATRGHGSGRKYEVRTTRLVELDVIDENLKIELDWVWQIRCNAHIGEVMELEHQLYTRDDYNRAQKAYASLRDALI